MNTNTHTHDGTLAMYHTHIKTNTIIITIIKYFTTIASYLTSNSYNNNKKSNNDNKLKSTRTLFLVYSIPRNY